MLIKREKIFGKADATHYNTIKRTSYWLLGIIPLYICDKIIGRS